MLPAVFIILFENQKAARNPALPATSQMRHHMKFGISQMTHGDARPNAIAVTDTM
jgi:hypothetical protein